MSKMSRNKGKNGELEVLRIFQQRYDPALEVKRNLTQFQESDCDLHRWGWSIEIKRQETLNLKAWWQQAVAASIVNEGHPAVIYRQSRQPWRVLFSPWALSPIYSFSDANTGDPDDFDYTVTMLLEPAFINFLKIRDELENFDVFFGKIGEQVEPKLN